MGSYERISSFSPAFYAEVVEMEAIYRADGKMMDLFKEDMLRVKDNCFVLTADEETTEESERFLSIKVYPTKSLDERRRLVAAYYSGFGKISKTRIKEMMKSFTGTDSDVILAKFGDTEDEAIYITLHRGMNETINAADVQKVLLDRIPGHILVVCNVLYSNEELKRSGITYGEMKKFTYQQLREGIPLEEVI